jgi:hypothetical protein
LTEQAKCIKLHVSFEWLSFVMHTIQIMRRSLLWLQWSFLHAAVVLTLRQPGVQGPVGMR